MQGIERFKSTLLSSYTAKSKNNIRNSNVFVGNETVMPCFLNSRSPITVAFVITSPLIFTVVKPSALLPLNKRTKSCLDFLYILCTINYQNNLLIRSWS